MTLALGIEDRSAHIVVIESAASARQMISTVLQELGFKNISSMDGIQAALDFLSQENADYVFCPLAHDDFPNALHLLKVMREDSALSGISVSLFVSEDSQSSIPVAFEMGAVSCHPRYFSKEAVHTEISKLLAALVQASYVTSTVALKYLCQHYFSAKKHDAGRKCIEEYLSHFPESRQARLYLADACLAAGDMEEGKRLLGQFKALDFPGWREIAAQYFSSPDEVPAQIGFTPCLVVDSDESVHNNLRALFAEFPEFRIVPFESGIAADEWCRRHGAPGLIIQEWKQRDLPGPALLQRMRQRGWHDLPILVLSSLVGKSDAPLLKEMGVTEVFQKPLIRESFRDALVFALVQERDPTDLAVLERKIMRLLNMGNFEFAKFLSARVQSHPKAKPGVKKYIESVFWFHQGKFEQARTAAFEAVQLGGDSLKCLTLLARTLVRLRDFSGAVRCFERAREISPENVERLCELADVYSESGDFGKADQTLQGAKQRDPTSELVARTESKVAIRSGQVERAKSIIIHMSQVSGLVSEMNNSAVALAKVGEFDQAFELYKHTYEALPEELAETRLRVKYNLALAYARAGRLKETLVELESVSNVTNGAESIFKKVESLRAKVRKSLESKRPLKLVSDIASEELISVGSEVGKIGPSDSTGLSDPLADRRAGLIGLFRASDAEHQVVKKSLEREVKFKRKKLAS
jgi:tetratricopeptide (TPR) repeat protein